MRAPVLAADATVADARAQAAAAAASGGVVAVEAGGALLGLVTPAALATAEPDAPLGPLAMAVTPVSPSTPIEAAASLMVRRGEPGVAVVGEDGGFAGLVPATQIIRRLVTEHDEDLARLGGYRASTARARQAAEEPLGRRLWHRLPWLVVGVAGAMASSVLTGAFEGALDRVVLLALFVPAVVYIADSVGTQTETLLIRALATEFDLRTVVRRELLTGVLLGAAIAAVFYPFAWLGWGNVEVAASVSLALLFSCAIASAVAMALPLLLRRLGFDPAFGSGPLATVIQDLLSIAIYFAIAVPIAA